MAIVNNPEDQEPNQQPGQPVSVSGTAGASSSSGQGAGVGGAAPQSPVAQNQAPQASSGYTDVSSYLDANKGGSQQLGNMVASNLNDTYNTTKGNIDTSATKTQSLADQGYTHENADLIKQAASNPVSLAADDNNATAVQAQLNDKYTGPTNWADFGTLQGQVNDAMQTGALNETPGGLNVLAQKVEGPLASKGINTLDSLLLGGSPDAMSTVKAAADPFKTLNDYINTQNTAVGSSINTAKTNADTAKNNATAALLGPSGATTQLNANVDSEVSAAKAKAQAVNDQVKAALGKEDVTPQDLANLGISQDQWNAIQGQLGLAQGSRTVASNQGQFKANTGTTDIDLNQWLTQQSPDASITRNNAATAEDYARAQALQKLVGSDRFTTDLTDASQAGTAPTNLNKFDYQGALDTTTGVASAEQKAAQAYVDALQSGADEDHAQAAAKRAQADFNATAVTAGPAAITSAVTNALGVGGTAGKIINAPTRAIGEGVNKAVSTVTNIFCFHPDTPIEMADGTTESICRIDVGDETKGGKVLAITKAVATDFYWYRGVVVTGKHAVLEDGVWIRVEMSRLAVKVIGLTEVVHNLVTSTHRIWAMNIQFADEHETDQYETLDLNESLSELNRHEFVG